MKIAWFTIAAGGGVLAGVVLAAQAPALRITMPERDTIVSGNTSIQVALEPVAEVANLKSLTVFANGRLVCTIDRPPLSCPWQPGEVVRSHHIRVVATMTDGRRFVDNVRTKELGYTERINAEAVLVPLIVTDGGQFVRGLKQQDFEIF